MHEAAIQREQPGPRFFRWLNRTSRPVAVAEVCGGCGTTLRPGGRYCATCGRATFNIGASEEVELPANRTASLAEGMLLVRYEPDSPAARWRTDEQGVRTGSQSGPVLVVKPLAEGDIVFLPKVLRPHEVRTRWGPSYELTPLEVSGDRLLLLVRRVN